MSPEEQFARNQRFNGHVTLLLTGLPNGEFALHTWGGSGELIYIGPADGLAKAYASRPAYSYTPRVTIKNISISDLEFRL